MTNPLSFSSVKLDLFSKEGVRLKPASGFIVDADNRHYLITNWHVLSGREVQTDEQSEPVVKPYLLKTSLHIYGGTGEKIAPFSMGMRKKITVQLYDDNESPRWIEHQTNKGNQHIVDIVALPIQVNLTLTKVRGATIQIIGRRSPLYRFQRSTPTWNMALRIPFI